MTQDTARRLTADAATADRFLRSLRQSLEHIDDTGWLHKHSPLASVFFAPAAVHLPEASGSAAGRGRGRQVVLTELREIDERLRATWHDWEARAKSPLQSAIWEAVCHLPADREEFSQAILLLTYFEEPRPKQAAIIQVLALGRSTYYRYLDRAVEKLGATLVQMLRPALRLELPATRALVGRTAELAQAHAVLRGGQVAHVVGGSGMGKTSLGAHLASAWGHGVFWYTFRRGLTDHLDQLVFALAYFLHRQGAQGLWLHVNTHPQEIAGSKVLAAVRQHLLDLRATPPLLCFDEVDLLLGGDLDDSEEHARLRGFLEDLAHSPRAGAPLLLLGQKLLLEPQGGGLVTLGPLGAVDAKALLAEAHVALDEEQQGRVLALTRGNPLLLRLLLALVQRDQKLPEALQQLTAAAALDWFMARLRLRLTPEEIALLYELSVYAGPAPRPTWHGSQRALRSLAELGLLETPTPETASLHPAIGAWLYQQLPRDRQAALHLAAAEQFAARSRFTAAAHHYMAAGEPALALWTWHRHRQGEIEQGQGGAALELFAPLRQAALSHPEDQRVLALVLAELSSPAGRTEDGLAALDAVAWPPAAPSSARAHQLRAELLTDVGEIDRALAEYRRSLEIAGSLRATEEVSLRAHIGRRALWYLHDLPQARREVQGARLDLELLQGEIEDMAGNYTAARTHYTNALALAEEGTTDHQRAKLHEVLGILEARYAQLEPAVAHIEAAGRHYQAAGNIVCAVGVTQTNLSYAYLVVRRYAEAAAPARRALAFFGDLNHPYWLALNEANLAEACFYLEEIEEAEVLAQQGLQREEVVVRPYCLYVLGHVRRVQGRLEEAESLCRAAIAAAEELEDLWGLAPAWRALGETLRDGGRIDAARDAFGAVLAIYARLGVEQELVFTRQLIASLGD
jgi:tetratricopeptide (TPR) repeat protein